MRSTGILLALYFIPSISMLRTRLCQSSTSMSPSDILLRNYENDLLDRGFEYIVGIDEAGRGPLAGPVVVASVIVSKDAALLCEVADSKVLSQATREEIFNEVVVRRKSDFIVDVEIVSHSIIDEVNILQATLSGMETSANRLCQSFNQSKCFAVIDGNKTPSKLTMSSRPLVKADALVYSVALASIIAKVTRDRIMVQYDEIYPGYGFAKHKGDVTRWIR